MPLWGGSELQVPINFMVMKKWFSSVQNAVNGIFILFKTERNARIEGTAALSAIFLSAWLHVSGIEWCIIILCITAVIGAEAINSSIERLADIYTKEHHTGIGKLKDISAGAVLLISFSTLLIGAIILGPPLLKKFGLT